MRKVELLVPAGDLEKLKFAVMYGADAVFVGSKEFSLRSRASNFTLDDLREGVKFCHEHNAKLYVTTNILPHNQDVLGLVDYLQELEAIGVDAIIASSFGVIYLAKKHTKLKIHISTQQSVSNSLGVNFYQEYGCERVVLARELSLSELKKIRKKNKIELEVFIHGGMCSSYSGRCVLSNYMTNRDANRGGCAHSCRWNYRLYQDDKEISDNEYFQFASKDLMAVRQLPELINYADSLKIEGRMKSIHYIATVTKVYREEIDEYLKNGKIKNFKKYEDEIKKCENREFYSGFLKGDIGLNQQLYNMRSERANQNFVGVILDYKDGIAKVDVRNYFDTNKKLEIFSPKEKNHAFIIDEIKDEQGNVIDAARHPRDIVYIKCPYKVKEYDMLRTLDE